MLYGIFSVTEVVTLWISIIYILPCVADVLSWITDFLLPLQFTLVGGIILPVDHLIHHVFIP